LRIFSLVFFFILLTGLSLSAQIRRQGVDNQQTSSNSARDKNARQAPVDTVKFQLVDSLLNKNSGITTTVKRYAKDSVIFNVKKKLYHLYTDAKVDYQPTKLEAAYIQLDWGKNEVFAHGVPDTTIKVGRQISGKPKFEDGTEVYHMDTIRYNFKSRKAKIYGVATEQEGGYIHGKFVKKDQYDNLHLGSAKYTTCNLAEPHFHIAAKKIMFINKKSALSGPFNIVVHDIPLPVGFFFGFFPVQSNKKEMGTSGFIMGTYGEQRNDGRGFYFNDFGYYHAFSEQLSSTTTFQVYTNGSIGAKQQFDYAKRYKYTGNFSFQYNRNVMTHNLGLRGKDYNPVTPQFNLRWSHAPRSLRTDRSFSSSMNLMSSGFAASNIQTSNLSAVTQNNMGGNINYMRNLGKLFTSTYSFSVSQNNQTFNSNLGYSLGLKQFNPFVKEKNQTGRWFESFRVGVNVNGGVAVNNTLTGRSSSYSDYNIAGVNNSPYTDEERRRLNELELLQHDLTLTLEQRQAIKKELTALRNPMLSFADALKNRRITNSYSVPITLPNIKVFKHINITPSISLRGDLYDKSLKYTFVERDSTITLSNGNKVIVKIREPGEAEGDSVKYRRDREGLHVDMGRNSGGVVVVDTVNGLSFANQMSFGLSMNTRLYGDLRFSEKRKIQAIRHTVNPSLSMGFTPANTMSVYQQVRSSDDPTLANRYLSKYIGGSGSSSRNSGNIGLSISNQLEAKVRSNSDTSETELEKVMLLDNFNIGTSYNIFADKSKNEFALSDIALSTSTALFKRKLNINATAALDPYLYEADPLAASNGNVAGIRRPIYKWKKGKEGFTDVGNYLTRFMIGVNTSLNPEVFNGNSSANRNSPGVDPVSNMPLNPMDYVDFAIPWNLNFAYNVNYTKQGLAEKRITQTLSFTGDVSFTKNTKITFNSGWDFTFQRVTLTTVGIVRELHCWMFSLNWTPISGSAMRSGGFNFTLQPKASLLKDLKITRRRAGSF
jgi:hypothetical protein